MLCASTNAFKAAHFEISIPNGARNIPAIPITITRARNGDAIISPCISSISRLPVAFSIAPTAWNIIDFDTAWNIRRSIAAQTVSSVPTPAQAVMRPRFEIVEYASTFLPSLTVTANRLAIKNVKPPTSATIIPACVPCIAGAMRRSR